MRHSFLDEVRFLVRWRAAMALDLNELTERSRLPDGYRIAAWTPGLIEAVAAVDYASYLGTIDGALYWRYFCSPHGCRRMWEEAFRGRFGEFDAARTRVLLHGDRVCGDVLCCNRSSEEGFIANIAVRPEARGGTGRALLLSALGAYRDAGFRRVSLAVTMANTRAYRLYKAIGFRRQYRFPVAARPGPAQWPLRGEGAALRGCR
jgi:ribosomal protein S18 acetylase RimI-like enzyme